MSVLLVFVSSTEKTGTALGNCAANEDWQNDSAMLEVENYYMWQDFDRLCLLYILSAVYVIVVCFCCFFSLFEAFILFLVT